MAIIGCIEKITKKRMIEKNQYMNNMKKHLLLVMLILLPKMANAQVSYGSITWGSYNMKIYVSTENESIFLNITYSDEELKLTDTPKLLLKLMDDTIISLEGDKISSLIKNDGGVIVSGVLVESNYYVSEAKFPITKEQILQLEKGIKKLRLNTSPKFHEKEWSIDRIGEKLYNAYIKSSSNSFEDGF